MALRRYVLDASVDEHQALRCSRTHELYRIERQERRGLTTSNAATSACQSETDTQTLAGQFRALSARHRVGQSA